MPLQIERKEGEAIEVTVDGIRAVVKVAAINTVGQKSVDLEVTYYGVNISSDNVTLSLTDRPRLTLFTKQLATLQLARIKPSGVQLICLGDRDLVKFLRQELLSL